MVRPPRTLPMIRFACPKCRETLTIPEQGFGREVSCQKCGQRLLIPVPASGQNEALVGQPAPSSAAQPVPPSGVNTLQASPPSDEPFPTELPGPPPYEDLDADR